LCTGRNSSLTQTIKSEFGKQDNLLNCPEEMFLVTKHVMIYANQQCTVFLTILEKTTCFTEVRIQNQFLSIFLALAHGLNIERLFTTNTYIISKNQECMQ
jgi:hypothetical protein